MKYKLSPKARIITFLSSSLICGFLTIVSDEIRYILIGLFFIILGIGLLSAMISGLYRSRIRANSFIEIFISIVAVQVSLGFIFVGLAFFFPNAELFSLSNYLAFVVLPHILFVTILVVRAKKFRIRAFYKYYEVTGTGALLLKIWYLFGASIITYLIILNRLG